MTTNKRKIYKIVDSEGNTVETFKFRDTAKLWLPKLEKDYFGEKLKIEPIE